MNCCLTDATLITMKLDKKAHVHTEILEWAAAFTSAAFLSLEPWLPLAAAWRLEGPEKMVPSPLWMSPDQVCA